MLCGIKDLKCIACQMSAHKLTLLLKEDKNSTAISIKIHKQSFKNINIIRWHTQFSPSRDFISLSAFFFYLFNISLCYCVCCHHSTKHNNNSHSALIFVINVSNLTIRCNNLARIKTSSCRIATCYITFGGTQSRGESIFLCPRVRGASLS